MRNFINILNEFMDNPAKTTGTPPPPPISVAPRRRGEGDKPTWHYVHDIATWYDVSAELGCTPAMPTYYGKSSMAFVLAGDDNRLVALATCSFFADASPYATDIIGNDYNLYWEGESGSHSPLIKPYVDDLLNRLRPAVDKYFDALDHDNTLTPEQFVRDIF